MPLEIIWSDSAITQLERLDRPIAKRIFQKVSQLKEDPYRNVKRIVGSPFFCLRVGDYRVIIDVQESVLRVLILKIGHRKKIYK
ncbi:MAG: type II toxin-antitoxin system RelE/ParE family toxin [Methanocellales archaeon]|nr:type II toxin-antitoxin system RelE/ParE family toxin [Methanocellales archaeon]